MTIFATQQAKFRRMCPNLTRWCGRAQKNCCWTLQKCENATETSACLACCEGTAAARLNSAMNLHEVSLMGQSLDVHRLHFAFTITFHYIFPQLTMGLTLLLVYLKTTTLRTGDEHY